VYVDTCMFINDFYIFPLFFTHDNLQIVHGTEGHMAVYGPGCRPQNIIWTEAKLRSMYYFVGDRPVHKLPFGPKCHELFVILYKILANLSDDMFFVIVHVYLRPKTSSDKIRKETLY